MKKSLIAATLIMVAGCKPEDVPDGVNTIGSSNGKIYQNVVIDECEYLFRESGESSARVIQFVHKGNCRACRKWLVDVVHAKAERQ